MSFDEEHLDEHYECQREVAERDARIAQLEAALAVEKENTRRGWELFETFRKKYAELRYPGMTGEVHAAALAPKEPT